MSPPKNDIQEFESAVKEIAHQQYVLRLYIAGTTMICSFLASLGCW